MFWSSSSSSDDGNSGNESDNIGRVIPLLFNHNLIAPSFSDDDGIPRIPQFTFGSVGGHANKANILRILPISHSPMHPEFDSDLIQEGYTAERRLSHCAFGLITIQKSLDIELASIKIEIPAIKLRECLEIRKDEPRREPRRKQDKHQRIIPKYSKHQNQKFSKYKSKFR